MNIAADFGYVRRISEKRFIKGEIKRADGMVEVQQELHLVEVVQLMLEQQMALGAILIL